MTGGTLGRDAIALRDALECDGPEVNVSLTRETAEFLARVVAARARGDRVLVARSGAEVSPNEAAAMLGMSRPQVRKLMDSGLLVSRKVGTHHRILVNSIEAFQSAERRRRQGAIAELIRVQDELGLTE